MAPTVGSAISGSGSDAGRDHFGGRASKLCALLELDASGSALAIGPEWTAWAPDLEERFATVARFSSAADLVLPIALQQLVLLDGGALAGLPDLARDELVASLLARLDARGSLLLFSSNRCALRRVLRSPASLFAAGGGGRRARRRLLERAGAAHVEEFLPLPELWEAEEIIGDASTIALPSHASRLDRLVLASGLYPDVHDGFIHIASHADGGTIRIRERIAAHLGAATDSITLDRFDLRSRGALVLIARRHGTRSRVVCRVATSDVTDERIRRNAALTTRVRDWPGLAEPVARLLPQALGTLTLPAGTAYVESLVEGIVAWKLAVPGATEQRLLQAAHDFTRDLGRGTARVAVLDAAALDALLDARAPGDASTDGRLVSLQAALRARYGDRPVQIVLSHGDYGYGNVMAERDGRLTGVIDWDQGRDDLAGVDLVNLLVQRMSGMEAITSREAFRRLHAVLAVEGLRGVSACLDYDAALPASFDDRTGLVAWSALRFVQRSAGYPALFTGFREEANALLAWALGLLAHGSE